MAVDETSYEAGSRAAWLIILREALRALGPMGSGERWRVERVEAIQALRLVCAEHGDNDWPDDLSICDIVNNHLARHLAPVPRKGGR